jgi:hypothetical protein
MHARQLPLIASSYLQAIIMLGLMADINVRIHKTQSSERHFSRWRLTLAACACDTSSALRPPLCRDHGESFARFLVMPKCSDVEHLVAFTYCVKFVRLVIGKSHFKIFIAKHLSRENRSSSHVDSILRVDEFVVM